MPGTSKFSDRDALKANKYIEIIKKFYEASLHLKAGQISSIPLDDILNCIPLPLEKALIKVFKNETMGEILYSVFDPPIRTREYVGEGDNDHETTFNYVRPVTFEYIEKVHGQHGLRCINELHKRELVFFEHKGCKKEIDTTKILESIDEIRDCVINYNPNALKELLYVIAGNFAAAGSDFLLKHKDDYMNYLEKHIET